MYYTNVDNGTFSVNMPYSGQALPRSLNSKLQKAVTYNTLSEVYAKKLAKYKNASAAYKKTAEYARLEEIVKRLRGILNDMDMGR